MLVNVPQPETIVAEMARLVRPGGVVALHEADSSTQRCDPPHPAQTRLLELLDALRGAKGIDRSIGLRAPRLLREAGLVDVQANPLIHVYPRDHSRRMLLLDFVENARRADPREEADRRGRARRADGGAPRATWRIPGRWSYRRSSSRRGGANPIVDGPARASGSRAGCACSRCAHSLHTPRMIRLDAISKQHGGQILFLDASAAVYRGEKVGLVGPNGSGKTTIFRLIVARGGARRRAGRRSIAA